MRPRNVLVAACAATALVASTAAITPFATAQPQQQGKSREYLVMFKGTSADSAARSSITRNGGTIEKVNNKLGYAVVNSRNTAFSSSMQRSSAVAGVAQNREIGSTDRRIRAKGADLERMAQARKALRGQATKPAKPAASAGSKAVTPEPLSNLQWDMRQIGATATGSYAKNPGSKKVLVGVIDTGIDGSHPDIAPNFDKSLSRNFVRDMTDIDGPCEHPSCVDPVDEDDDGHGTHVASTIGSPVNGLGIAGVAPNVTLVNIRAGQDSGYFFLDSTLQALTYAGDIGVDVVNMSFYTDPWLYNCTDNPADTPSEQAEQQTIRTLTQRAMNYATKHDVLPVAAMGNEATDLNNPTSDDTSPDYPADAAHPRTVDNSCITVPTETKGVMAVSATGPSTRLAYYSNYGTEQTDVAAPGGDAYDSPDNKLNPQNLVLAAYPAALAKANGDLNSDGTPNNPFVVRDCKGSVCAYYQYLQGTSMATPHAVGVAALAVSQFGKSDRNGGLSLSPKRTEQQVYRSAQPHACPEPREFHWTRISATAGTLESSAYCRGGLQKNGFYGHGIVNAYAVLGTH
jgi:subtilisin family serine protease